MRVTVDLSLERIIVQPGFSQEVRSMECKRSLQTNFEVQFTRNGGVVELPNDATGIFGIKDKDKFDGDYVAAALTWVKTGSGVTTLYTFSVNFITVALDALFKVDGNPNNDAPQLLLMAELQWQTGGQYFKSQTVEIRLNNDVNRGGETVSPMPSIAYGVFLPEITRLEGGTAIDLDNVATIGLVTGYIIEVLVDVGLVRTWLTYVLTAGPVTDVAPGQVEPLDYDSMTNDRHWLGAVGPSGPQGVSAGHPYLWNTSTANTDPGAGKVKVNNATLASATALYISETDNNARALAALLATWDDSTSPIRGRVMFQDPATPANFAVFDITGTRSDNGAWDTFTLAYVASGGTLTNNLPVQVIFFAKGDKGDQGDAGFKYLFNSATAGDPTSGKFLFNHATFLAATQLLIHETDTNANGLAALLATLDDSTSPNKCLVVCQKASGLGYFAFYITAALTDNGAYDTFPITPIASAGSISNNDIFFLSFARVGDIGGTGLTGATGREAALQYLFNTSVSNANPGAGKLALNNATLASATALYINETDFDTNVLSALLATWDDGTSTVKGRLFFHSPATPTIFAVYDITGTITDNGAWDTFTIAHVASGGVFTNNLPITAVFLPKGDLGNTGATGPGYLASSATSLAIGTGSKAFTVAAGLAYSAGARVRATSQANTANWMEGLVTAYSSTTLTVLMDLTNGSGTHADWDINLAGERGVQGAAGVGVGGYGVPVGGAAGEVLRKIDGTDGNTEWEGFAVPDGGTAGQVLTKIDGTDGNSDWETPSGGGDDYILVRDEKPDSTGGGSFSNGAWRTRDLNTEVSDAGGHASLSANQITLAAGTYRCYITCPAVNVGRHQGRLFDITNTAVLALGSSEYTISFTTRTVIAGRFTLAGTTVLEVQHQGDVSDGGGFGVSNSFGNVQVYTVAEFFKES